MASDESMSMTPHSSVYSCMHDHDVDSYLAYGHTDDDDAASRRDDMYDDDEGGQEGDGVHMGIQMSRLSLETWESDGDANTQLFDHVDDDKGGASGCDDDDDGGVAWGSTDCLSLPVTPIRLSSPRRAGSTKDYASESEAARGRHGGRARRMSGVAAGHKSCSSYCCHCYRRSRRARERRLDRAWEMKRCHRAGGDGGPDSPSGGGSPCVMVRSSGPGAGCMWMDMEEVKACRDLGLELPCDWTVEIPPDALTAAAMADADGGGDSPVGNWRISRTGDGPGDMKARLRVWAQAVALASASRLIG